MSDPLLSICNRHAPSCGDPPIIKGHDPNVYVGYFENEHGQQWIFTFDRRTHQTELRGGDAGWTKMYRVGESDGQLVTDVILSDTEKQWLQSCWNAVTAFTKS